MALQNYSLAADDKVYDAVIALSRSQLAVAQPRFSSSPILHALMTSGTSHIYADTADYHELADLLEVMDGELYREVGGNTVNQPLVHKVIGRYLAAHELERWVRQLRGEKRLRFSNAELARMLYAVICGRIGNDILRGFAGGRLWEISLQLHMGLVGNPEASKLAAQLLRATIPTAIVKVPFAPHAPDCLLVARDLENEGIPVNFTSTFSARQAVAAGLLSNVTRTNIFMGRLRTNIFMGRLNEGLHAELLGEHVTLAAQHGILRERQDTGIKTQLIVASVREWRTLVRTAGCDVFTAPCATLEELISRAEIDPDQITNQLGTSYADKLGIAADVRASLGDEQIGRLYRIEDGFVEFLREFRQSAEFARMHDGDEVFQYFDGAGFGDFFYSPSKAEWETIRKNKLPDLGNQIVRRCSLDTLYSLLADGDFQNHQDEMDHESLERVAA
jgi:transaldolase